MQRTQHESRDGIWNDLGSTLRRVRSRGGRGQLALLLAAMLAVIGCGAPTSQPGQTGSLSLTVTDAPSDDYAAINLTIEKIELLGGDGGAVTLSEETSKFDLLALHDVSELLLSADDVPVGHYAKIRLWVTEIELVSPDGSVHYADVPAEGKLDLLPRGGFDITRDEDLAFEIDIDANKSILVHPVGWGMRYQFRPVVFMRRVARIFDGRVVRMHGRIENLDPTAARFDLCHLRPPLAWLMQRGSWQHAEAGTDMNMQPGGPDQRPPTHCRHVALSDSASIFDTQGEPTSLRALSNGDELTAIGRMGADDRSLANGVTKSLVLHAELALLGAQGSFRSYRGFVASEVDSRDRFALEIGRGQGIAEGSVVDVQLYADRDGANGTKLYSRSGLAIGRDAIALDLRTAVTGILFLSNTDPDTLSAALVIVDLDATGPNEPPVAGMITAISSDPALQRIRVQEPGQIAGTCVDVPDTARIVLKTGMEGGECSEGEYEDLTVGDQVSVYGRPSASDSDCMRARAIVDYGSAP